MEFLNFARDLRGFESKEWLDWENYNNYKSIILICDQKRKRKIRNYQIPIVSLPKQFINLLEYEHSDSLIIYSAQ